MTAISAPWDPRVATLRAVLRRWGHRAAFARHGPDDEAYEHGPDDPHGHHGPHGHHPKRGRFRGPGGPFGAGFGFPFGPGFGPPFGGFPGKPRGRRGRRSRGDIRLAVLALLAEQPRHGYEIIQEVAQRTNGAWRPSPGSVYPTLQQLEDEGLVRTETSEGRRNVTLTEAGAAYVEEHKAELDRVWEIAGDEPNVSVTELRTQYAQLHAAVAQIAAAGTDEQRETAATALAEARKTIYRLLAED